MSEERITTKEQLELELERVNIRMRITKERKQYKQARVYKFIGGIFSLVFTAFLIYTISRFFFSWTGYLHVAKIFFEVLVVLILLAVISKRII
jgi:hypothetical protein